MNVDFLKKVMTSDCYYWLVAKQCHKASSRGLDRDSDEILFVAIPIGNRPYKVEDIKLVDMERLEKKELLTNIFLSEPYPPFQMGQTMYWIYDGFPLDEVDVMAFLKEAQELGSNKLWDYKPIIDKHTKKRDEMPIL